jgi:hypothetical protein
MTKEAGRGEAMYEVVYKVDGESRVRLFQSGTMCRCILEIYREFGFKKIVVEKITKVG